jgi:UDP-N-acetylglucosamine 2-epimerase
VRFVDAEPAALRRAVRESLHDAAYREQVRGMPCPFGDGHAAERVTAVLASLDPRSLLPKPHRWEGHTL